MTDKATVWFCAIAFVGLCCYATMKVAELHIRAIAQGHVPNVR